MSIFTKETPLKVWHLIVFIVLVASIYFTVRTVQTWKQVRINTANIQVIGNFLNPNNQPQAQPTQPVKKAPTEEEIK